MTVCNTGFVSIHEMPASAIHFAVTHSTGCTLASARRRLRAEIETFERLEMVERTLTLLCYAFLIKIYKAAS